MVVLVDAGATGSRVAVVAYTSRSLRVLATRASRQVSGRAIDNAIATETVIHILLLSR